MVEQDTFSATPGEVSLKSNWLYVDGQQIRANVLRMPEPQRAMTGDELHEVIVNNRFKILDGIIDFTWPGATAEPSIFTARLATTKQMDGADSKLFTAKGYANGGVNESRDEIQDGFHPHWNAIVNAGFRPEVRRMTAHEGAWLLLRRPTIPQVALEWFSYTDGLLLADFVRRVERDPNKKVQGGPEWFKRLAVIAARRDQMATVDRVSDRIKRTDATVEQAMWARTTLQIGTQLSLIALKQTMEYEKGIAEDIDEVLEYASNSEFVPTGAALAIENATYG